MVHNGSGTHSDVAAQSSYGPRTSLLLMCVYIYLADFGDILFIIFLQKDPSWDTGYVTNPASFGTAFAQ